MVALAQRLGQMGARAELVIIGREGPLVDRLSASGLQYHVLGFARGRDAMRQPRRWAHVVASTGPDGALVTECGFLGAALRVGGYDRAIVATEHGAILDPDQTCAHQALDLIRRASGAWADDAEVAVSEYVLTRMRRRPHARRLHRIYNGVDPDQLSPREGQRRHGDSDVIVAGFVGRLIPRKGLDVLIRALAAARDHVSARLLVAGDGPDRARVSSLAWRAGIGEDVEFLGIIDDIQAFWDRCDIAIVPSTTWIESFCLAAVEAMACGKPVIATRRGALPEVVVDGVTGTLVSPGDHAALADAIVSYARLPSMRREHALAARRRAVECFHIDHCAKAYLELFASIDRRPR